MIYIFGIIFLAIIVIVLIFCLKEQQAEEKFLNSPYRVAKNGVGKYLLQEYKKIQHEYITDNPKDEDYHYEWVTINTYNDLLEAKIEYRIRMSELKYKKQKEEESRKSEEESKKQLELENTIVEIIDIDDVK